MNLLNQVLRLKTIPVFSNNRLKEAMSYENIDYEELYNNDNGLIQQPMNFLSADSFYGFSSSEYSVRKFHFDYGPMILEKAFFGLCLKKT